MLLHIRDKNGELLYWSRRLNDHVRVGSTNRYDNIPERKLTLSEYRKWLKRNGYKEYMPYWKRKNHAVYRKTPEWSR